MAHTGESIAIIDKIVHGKFIISAATHEYCKCFDGFVAWNWFIIFRWIKIIYDFTW